MQRVRVVWGYPELVCLKDYLEENLKDSVIDSSALQEQVQFRSTSRVMPGSSNGCSEHTGVSTLGNAVL